MLLANKLTSAFELVWSELMRRDIYSFATSTWIMDDTINNGLGIINHKVSHMEGDWLYFQQVIAETQDKAIRSLFPMSLVAWTGDCSVPNTPLTGSDVSCLIGASIVHRVWFMRCCNWSRYTK